MPTFARTEFFKNESSVGTAIPHPDATTLTPLGLELTSDGFVYNGTSIDEVRFSPSDTELLLAAEHSIEIRNRVTLVVLIPPVGGTETVQKLELSDGGVTRWTLTVKTKPKLVAPLLSSE